MVMAMAMADKARTAIPILCGFRRDLRYLPLPPIRVDSLNTPSTDLGGRFAAESGTETFASRFGVWPGEKRHA